MEDLFGSIYKNKKVLVTGNTGFKGSWLAFWLIKLGANVKGISLEPNTNPNHFNLLNLPIETNIIDIRDYEKLKTCIASINPDIIFHLAAQPLVRCSYKETLKTFNTNVIGTANIFEIARQHTENLKAIINITTDKCYENKETNRAYLETDHLGGYDPYSASKACSEIITSSYRNSFFNKNDYNKTHSILLASARAGNVIGGGDWSKDRLIPDLVKATKKGNHTIIRSPDAIRPWQHVLEPLTGYLLLGQELLQGKKQFADAWNFGPKENEFLSVQDILILSQKHWNEIKIEVNNNTHLHEAKILKLNSEKANLVLKWNSIWSINEAIEKTISWYKEYYISNIISSDTQLYEYVGKAKSLKYSWT